MKKIILIFMIVLMAGIVGASLIPTTIDPATVIGDDILSNGDRTVTFNGTGNAQSLFSATTGKWYWEVSFDSGEHLMVGVLDSQATYQYLIYSGLARVYYSMGYMYQDYGVTFGAGDIIGVAVDLNNNNIQWFKNGVVTGTPYNILDGYDWRISIQSGASAPGPRTATIITDPALMSYNPPEGFTKGFGSIVDINPPRIK